MKYLLTSLFLYSFICQAEVPDTISWGEVRLKSNQNYIIENTEENNYTLSINEILASNSTGIEDEDNDHDDWFEIFNYGDEPILLDSLFFSDDLKELYKWQFLPDTNTWLAPLDFFIFWADNETNEGTNHTNFKLSSDGEVVSIATKNLDLIDLLEFNRQIPNVSYGRYPDGGEILNTFFTTSPYGANSISDITEILPEVSSNLKGGIVTSPQQLILSIGVQDAVIRYTTDCSVPTEASPEFILPIAFDTTTIIRTKAFKEGALESQTVTLSFIFTENDYDNNVISLVSDQENFTGTNGIFTKPTSDLEIPSHFDYFEKGTFVFSANTGVKLHSPKSTKQYSMRLYARGSYGDTWFEYPFFDDLAPIKFKRLLLRNAGNDNVQKANGNTHMRDHIVQRLAQQSNRDASISEIKVVNVYLNGEYYGVYNLRERIDKYYVETHSGETDFDLLERCFGYSGNKYAIEGSFDQYNSDQTRVDTLDLSDNNYLDSIIDKYNLDNYLDYWITEVFVGNYDWLKNNTKMWSSYDKPWRWIYWDTDHSIGLTYADYGNPEWNTLAWSLGFEDRAGTNGENNILIRNFLENDSIKEVFIKQFTYLLNTSFSTENTHHLTDSIIDIYKNDILFHFERWYTSYSNTTSWYSAIDVIKDYFSQRPDIVRQHLQTQFNLETPIKLTLNIEPTDAGVLQIDGNTISGNPFNGLYFPNYNYTINVKSRGTYVFDHWEGIDAVESNFDLSLSTDTVLTAVFRDTLTLGIESTLVSEKIYCYEKTLVIEHNNDQLLNLKIYNIKGLVVKSLVLTPEKGSQTEISLDNIPDGIYIVSLDSKSEKRIQKIITY